MTVIVDNTGFNVTYWSRFTEAEFIEMNMRHAFRQYGDKERRELLLFAYQQIRHDLARTTKEAKRV